MENVQTRLYEGLFLFPSSASTDLGSAIDHLKEILDRAETEVVLLKKWDDRKLAYTMRGQKRGTYLLTYFHARPSQIANIERDVTLSEHLIRSLIIKAEHVGETELDLAKKDTEANFEASVRNTPATPKPTTPVKPSSEVATAIADDKDAAAPPESKTDS